MRQREEGAAGIPLAARGAPRTSRRTLLGAAGAGVLALAASQTQPAVAQDPVVDITVFPRHGTRTASPGTEISFRGVTAGTLGGVDIVGSQSGGHSGLLMPHSDGKGVSYVPDAPFAPGERVTVQAGVPLRANPGGFVTFDVAVPGIPVKKDVSREVDQPESPPQEFRTRLDLLPPEITITTLTDATGPGHTFLAAKVPDGRNGAMILDEDGDLVWFSPLDIDVAEHNDFRVQQYRGESVLTMWEGVSQVGTGFGHLVLLNGRYEAVARLQVGNGYHGADLHECLLTPRATALIIVYNPIRWNLAPGGGDETRTALDGIVQELDIETGRVIFEWHSLDYIDVDEGIGEPPENIEVPWDYFHLNSIEEDDSGDLILSARNANGIYKVERATGRVLWRLNGTRSDFAMGEGTPFAYQHDARVHVNGELTLFDNAASDQEKEGEISSRGVVLQLDEEAKTATLVREYIHPTDILAVSQGNMQVLSNGNVFIGWGSAPVFSEFDAEGNLLFNGRFPQGANSYRAYRLPWVGTPGGAPDIAIEAGLGDDLTVYVSWNGATEVVDWEVLAGPDPEELAPVARGAKIGFETALVVTTAELYLAVRALDTDGEVLGVTEPVMPRG